MKPVKVDVNGNPYGTMKATLAEDIRKMAKELDPTCSWEVQPSSDRRRFFTRLYSDWNVECQDKKMKKINEKWFKPIITKSLINHRWKLNQLIDSRKPRPLEVSRDHWNILGSNRTSDGARVKSDQMRSISTGKGCKASLLKAIEKDALIKLSIALQRAPYDSELQEEVGKEFSRQEHMKRSSLVDHGKDIDEVRTRMLFFEGSVARMDSRMEKMQQNMEDLLGQLLVGQVTPISITVPELAERPSNVQADLATTSVVMDKNVSEVPGNVSLVSPAIHGDAADTEPNVLVPSVAFDIVPNKAVEQDKCGGDDPYALSGKKGSPIAADQNHDDDAATLLEKDTIEKADGLTVRSSRRVVKSRSLAATLGKADSTSKAGKVTTVKGVQTFASPEPNTKAPVMKKSDAFRRK